MLRKPTLFWVFLTLSSALALPVAHAAQADDVPQPMFAFRGFGTVGVTNSSEKEADFTSTPLKANGAGFSRSWSADVDSRIGAQLNANFNSKLTAVVQIIAEQRYDNTYTPIVEWANVKYQVTPDFSVRVGRTALPIFLAADYRKVGYTLPWARTPVEVYGMVPVSNSDGVDTSYRLHVAGVTNTVQGFYGKTSFRFGTNSHVSAKELWGISNTTDYGPATVRISYLQSNLTSNLAQPLFDAFRQFGPQGMALANKYEVKDKTANALSLGVSYDPGDWFLMGEWGRLKINSFHGEAWYVSGGHRFGDFTPYVTYSQVKANSNTSDPGLDLSTLPPHLVGPATDLNAGLNLALGAVPVQESATVGVRWDFRPDVALKVEYGRLNPGAGSPGTFINTQPAFQPGGAANVFTVVLDFVY